MISIPYVDENARFSKLCFQPSVSRSGHRYLQSKENDLSLRSLALLILHTVDTSPAGEREELVAVLGIPSVSKPFELRSES